jgi:hypothetical protein
LGRRGRSKARCSADRPSRSLDCGINRIDARKTALDQCTRAQRPRPNVPLQFCDPACIGRVVGLLWHEFDPPQPVVPRTTVYPGRYFVTTKSVTGWQQYTDAAAVPTWIGAAQVREADCAAGDNVCIGSQTRLTGPMPIMSAKGSKADENGWAMSQRCC